MGEMSSEEDLIAEAREWPRDGVNEGPLINALADRIEHQAKEIAMLRDSFSARSYERQMKRAEKAEAELADATRTMAELQPDPVLVEDSWIPVADLPTVCGNFMRLSNEYARDAKDYLIRAERAESEASRSDRVCRSTQDRLAYVEQQLAAERERCARIADRGYKYGETCDDIARDIRSGVTLT